MQKFKIKSTEPRSLLAGACGSLFVCLGIFLGAFFSPFFADDRHSKYLHVRCPKYTHTHTAANTPTLPHALINLPDISRFWFNFGRCVG